MPSKKSSFQVVSLAVALALIVGALSGVSAAVLTNQSMNAYIESLAQEARLIQLSQVKPRPLPGTYEESLSRVQETALPGVAVMHEARTSVQSVSRLQAMEDVVSAGAVVTSDGWIAFHQEALEGFTDPETQLSVTVRGNTYSIDRVVEDSVTELVMVHLQDARDLPSLAFGATENMDGGEIVFSAARPDELLVTSLVRAHDMKEDLVLPAEIFPYAWQLLDTPEISSPLFNSSGELIGFYGEDSSIPMHQAVAFVQSVLRTGEVERSSFGAYVLHLDTVTNLSEEIASADDGALILSPTPGVSAVILNGPADAAGLRAGDIVTAIEGVRINETNRLADILSDYRPGSLVVVSIEREGEKRDVEVTLGDVQNLVY